MALSRVHNLALRRSRRTGLRICLTAGVLALLFLLGLAQRSYWALAIPVAMGVLAALFVFFWIGYTILTVRGIPEEAEHYSSHGLSRWIAMGICMASAVLALGFVLGLLEQSYWALAVPVTLAVLGLLGMVFWIGWAIVIQKTTLTVPATADVSAASPAATGPAATLAAPGAPAITGGAAASPAAPGTPTAVSGS